jgi:N6-L-threonylcarbamoyladenine synthase
MLTLGIETSCDETAAAVLENGQSIRSNIVYSQIKDHMPYGGVVPEIASRQHLRKITPVVSAALDEARCTLADIGLVAVTNRPGLIGSLLVGTSFAKAAAYATKKPIIGVNHIEAHFFACLLQYPDLPFPCIGLIVSGGHTHIFHCPAPGEFIRIGQTQDDAAGEAYDKVAKMLDLGYPGGPLVDKLAKDGDPARFRFPRALLKEENFDFSFSGLKTAVLVVLNKMSPDERAARVADICAGFQAAMVEVLVEKTLRAVKAYKVAGAMVAGGVACNSRLKVHFFKRGAEEGIRVFIPSPAFCTDNAAMVAACGYQLFQSGKKDTMDMDTLPNVEYNA